MSQRFSFIKTPLDGLFKIDRKPIVDNRGFFSRLYCEEEFKEIGFDQSIAQINYTLTKQKGTVRGLHFQLPPYAETKIVTCIQGEVWDVAVDIRKNSPTFLQWHAERLSTENQSSLYIPDGFAHGFQTLSDNCQLIYLHSTSYVASAEGGINVQDPMLAIDWPLTLTEVSERDKNHPMLDLEFEGLVVQ